MNVEKKYKHNLIDHNKWQEYQKINNVLKGNICLEEHNLKNQRKLWNFIVEKRNILRSKIMKSIRVNTGMCCKVNEEGQIKNINMPLFKFNHLFDQNFYSYLDYDYEGLNKFLKLLKSTFGNVESFIFKIKRVNSIIEFVEKGRDKLLIKEYNYLKNITLPISGYESLRMDLITILKKYNQLTPVITEYKNYKEFIKEINKFKKVYIIEYQKRHLFYQNKIDYLKRKIITLPSYRLLKKLNNIDNLKNMDTIDYIDSFFNSKCNKDNINRILLKQPKCHCGFTIGENLTIPSLDKIKPMLYETIKNYIKLLKKKLKDYYQNNPDSCIKNIYNLESINNIDDTDLLNIFNKKMINEINSALGNKNIVNININEITKKLEGSYTFESLNTIIEGFKEKLYSKVEDYTGNIDNKNVIIKIVNKGQ